MRKLALLSAFVLSVGMMACGSSDEPVDDTGNPADVASDVQEDNGSDEDIPVQVDTVQDNGTDNAWMDMNMGDTNIPEGPFYAKEEGDLVTVSDGRLTVVLNLVEGTFNIGFNPGLDGIINGHSEAWFKSVEGESVVSSLHPSQRAGWEAAQTTDGLDDGVVIAMETIPTGSIGGLRTYIALHRNTPAVTIKLMMTLPVREGFLVTKLVPVVASGSDGAGLLLGPGTASAKFATNGHEISYDGNAEALNVTDAVETLNAPGYMSDWSGTLCTKAGKCVVAGYLNVVNGFTGVAVASDPVSAFAVGDDAALSLFEMRSRMVQGAMLSPSRILTSEVAYLDFTDDPAAALARYATAIATYNAVPTLKAAPYAYTAAVDIDNMTSSDVAASIANVSGNDGFDVFLVDRGWEDMEKNPDATDFPNHSGANAMKWLADEIKAGGMKAGIGLDPFVFDSGSTFFADHADWMVAADELAVVRLGLGNTAGILDLTNDDARTWAVNYVKTAVNIWGYEHVRLYGVDLACLGAAGSVEGKTAVAAMRQFFEELRTAVGNDVYIELADGSMIGTGLVDGIVASLPEYASWAAPANKVDATAQMAAMGWMRRSFLDGTVFNVMPGRMFNFNESGALTDLDRVGMQLWAVTGGLPNMAGLQAVPGVAAELAGLTVKDAWSPDYMDLKLPETWYSTVDMNGVVSYLAGFFRFGDNMDLYTLAPSNGTRTRTLSLPAAEGSWLAMNPATGDMLAVEGNCINPDGAEFTLENGPTSSRMFVLRKIASSTEPTFLGLMPSIAGGDGYITSMTSGSGATSITFDTFDRGDTTVMFAVPVGSTATLSVDGGSELGSGTSAAVCGDMQIQWIQFTPTAVQATVTATL